MATEPQFERLVIAAYRLPFKYTKTKTGYKAVQNTGGLVSAVLALSENLARTHKEFFNNKIIWAGVQDNAIQLNPAETIENQHFDIVPISIAAPTNDLYYGGFCNDLIWPLFHYFPSYCVFNDDYFAAYLEANLRFRDELVKVIQPGDFVWIHDYQLLLLPEMIRQALPDTTIGFFLHIPFPSFELFRILPRQWREAIVKGLLGADIIGFHTHDYAQHFIQSVKRTTSYECKQNLIYTHNKVVKAGVFPIGIDYEKFRTACSQTKIVRQKIKLKKIIRDQKLIFSVDRLDYSKGLLARLVGYEIFLEKYPEWHKKITFNFVVVPSRDNIKQYREMKKEIESTVGRINGKYGSIEWRPIAYQYKFLNFHELVALYNVSDICLITPLRDGMNLVSKEYVACQNEGVLILSEVAGAADELNEAILINPLDKEEMANAIVLALTLPPSERRKRMQKMKERILFYDVFRWALDFFGQTQQIKTHQHKMKASYIDETVAQQITLAYQQAYRRIFLLDYDGTLVPFANQPENALLPASTALILQRLACDPNNEIVIMSGRNKEFLEQQFSGLNVSLVGEHGYFIKRKEFPWKTTINADTAWKNNVRPLLEEYLVLCKGSSIEEKCGSLVWHYRNADFHNAKTRLHELRTRLSEVLRNQTELEILEGNKVLEIKCGKYDKGEATREFINNQHYDFLLAAGDDRTDEFIFKVLPEKAYSIHVGTNPSVAKHHVPDINTLLVILKKLSGLTTSLLFIFRYLTDSFNTLQQSGM